ncbi:MAG: glycerophosphodiester phosphodiesterase family protein [Betaproteobacteria bacterium]
MVMIVGHRGARNLWPENSLAGFRKLLTLGVDAVEFDVHETRDQQFVVIHDPSLARTTDRTGAIRDLTAAEVLASPLRPVPAPPETGPDAAPDDQGECVPGLDAVLGLLRESGLELHIEIKADAVGEFGAGMVGRLIDAIHGNGVQQRSILTCFVPEVLEQVCRLWPQCRVLASLDLRSAEMLGGIERALARYAALHGCIVAVEKTLLAASGSRCLDVLGRERLGVWVVNDPGELAHWTAMPLRQITTDRPDLALAARDRLQRRPAPPT